MDNSFNVNKIVTRQRHTASAIKEDMYIREASLREVEKENC